MAAFPTMDLNVKHETVEFIFKNRRKFQCLGLGKDLLDLMPKMRSIKGNVIKLDFIEIKTFSSAQASVKEMNQQATE